MSAVNYVAVFCCVILITCSAQYREQQNYGAHESSAEDQKLKLFDFRQHNTYVADFSCQPQPRTIPVEMLITDEEKAYYPDITVLHRCDMFSGSCESGKKCSVGTSEEVQIPFHATYLEDTENQKAGSWEIQYISAMNHTGCVCAMPTPWREYEHTDYPQPQHPTEGSGEIIISSGDINDDDYDDDIDNEIGVFMNYYE